MLEENNFLLVLKMHSQVIEKSIFLKKISFACKRDWTWDLTRNRQTVYHWAIAQTLIIQFAISNLNSMF